MTRKTIKSREEWLKLALNEISERMFEKAGASVPTDCKVSVGFPGGGSARKRIGECWPRSRSTLGVNEIFINPKLRDQFAMLEVLVHEAIHAADDCASGHKGFFRKTAKAVGLEGKMTATHAGPELASWIKDVLLQRLPALEYGSLLLDDVKRQSTRMLKIECPSCGYVARTTAKWLEVGVPTCCCGTEMGVA